VYDIFLYMTVTQHERPEVHYRKQYANISSYKHFCSVNTMSDTPLFFDYHLTLQFIQLSINQAGSSSNTSDMYDRNAKYESLLRQ